MKVKTIVELLALSSSIYSISKDKEFFERLEEMAKKGKEKVSDIVDEFTEGEYGENQIIAKLIVKAKHAKEEFDKKMEETAITVYQKMHIAHTQDLENAIAKIDALDKKVNLLEARLNKLGEEK